ncbi:Carboxylesterase type B [Macrophomina phaseolina MS6]|uniref:Carboxylic ester hydrolase n=1 Tax=Macrophomina phaseolina (strain MS6) TaxID=1126212 RepID=K2RR60_MACPH|nr:Carboxylesterase type B [Macrophomina phaseolina MS6]
MDLLKPLLIAVAAAAAIATASPPTAVDTKHNITYHGLTENAVDKFLNIPYAQDTSGARRFAPPLPYVFPPNVTHYDASAAGPVCPQPAAPDFAYMSEAAEQSEDCLRLKIARPAGTEAGSGLPVMVYIYGGGLFTGHINERTNEPDALVAESVANRLPVVYVAMNYRLNIFGFALSEALGNNSLNVGLKDQRLALEWVQENIEYFGGDPKRVTIFGQSSGGLSVGLQVLAYGGTRPVPFQAAIMQSTALEPTSASNLTLSAFNSVAALTNCTSPSNPDPQSATTLSCLRALPFTDLLAATIADHDSKSTTTDGDIWLPTTDHDFLPAASSTLTLTGAFPRIPLLIGWTEDDATLFTPRTITTPTDTAAFLSARWPALSTTTISALLSLYPSSDFAPRANLSAEFYRAAQIFRDILLVCPSFLLGGAMAQKYTPNSINASATAHNDPPPVYYYTQNQTVLTPYLAANGLPGLGVVHTSDLAYVFANFTPVLDEEEENGDGETAFTWRPNV